MISFAVTECSRISLADIVVILLLVAASAQAIFRLLLDEPPGECDPTDPFSFW